MREGKEGGKGREEGGKGREEGEGREEGKEGGEEEGSPSHPSCSSSHPFSPLLILISSSILSSPFSSFDPSSPPTSSHPSHCIYH